MSQAYQQLTPDEDSKNLLVVNKPKGLTINSFSNPSVSNGQGLPVDYLDDILIATKTEEEHNQLLEQTLERLEKAGIRLKQEKCEFHAKELQYLSHCISATGIHPTEEKVQAIKEHLTRKCKLTLCIFGANEFYSKFILRAASRLAPLYKLLQKNCTWPWTEECTNVFQECKSLLTSDVVLAHYDAKKQLKLSCDASQYGLGANLPHVTNGKVRPIAFSSQTLSKAKRNYGQVEKEALALIFGVKSSTNTYMADRSQWIQTTSPFYLFLTPKQQYY